MRTFCLVIISIFLLRSTRGASINPEDFSDVESVTELVSTTASVVEAVTPKQVEILSRETEDQDQPGTTTEAPVYKPLPIIVVNNGSDSLGPVPYWLERPPVLTFTHPSFFHNLGRLNPSTRSSYPAWKPQYDVQDDRLSSLNKYSGSPLIWTLGTDLVLQQPTPFLTTNPYQDLYGLSVGYVANAPYYHGIPFDQVPLNYYGRRGTQFRNKQKNN